jgi:biopolymer transport protein TolQ
MTLLALWLFESDLARLVLQTGWVARAILLLLLLFSVLSWAIIYRKHTEMRLARQQTEKFLQAFRSTDRLPDPRPVASLFEASPLLRVYAAGMRELESQVGTATAHNPHPRKIRSLNALAVSVELATSAESARLEHHMSFLATTGSVTPFIGLFGTVWGIINAFMGLGEAGATTLRAVAPGIAEALIATAAGLFAAIPAVIAYNHFLHRIRQFVTWMDSFAAEFVARAEKLYA